MSSQQHSQSFEDDCSLSDFDSAGLSLCNVSEMENFTGNSNLETETGSVEIVDVAKGGGKKVCPMILRLILVLFACHLFLVVQERRNLVMMQA